MARKVSDTVSLTGAAIALVAAACCAGLPAAAALLGGFGMAALFSGSGVVLLIGVVGAVWVVRSHARRRRCAADRERARS